MQGGVQGGTQGSKVPPPRAPAKGAPKVVPKPVPQAAVVPKRALHIVSLTEPSVSFYLDAQRPCVLAHSVEPKNRNVARHRELARWFSGKFVRSPQPFD